MVERNKKDTRIICFYTSLENPLLKSRKSLYPDHFGRLSATPKGRNFSKIAVSRPFRIAPFRAGVPILNGRETTSFFEFSFTGKAL